MRIIGDLHQKYDKYLLLTEEADYTLQVGDVGFFYDKINHLNPEKHKRLGGNHDNYTKIDGQFVNMQTGHWLGDFGVYTPPNFESIFYVRGAWSIDAKYRTPDIDWWADEELSYENCTKAIELYNEVKPDFVVTHTVPSSIIPYVPFKKIFGPVIHGSRTETMLQRMHEIHQPKTWVFGHWHVDWDDIIKGTRFICLNELSHMDF
jgi:predicted phosphodiesterase